MTKTSAPRTYVALVDAVQHALTEQSVTLPGVRAAEMGLPQLTAQLSGSLAQRSAAVARLEETLMRTLLPRS